VAVVSPKLIYLYPKAARPVDIIASAEIIIKDIVQINKVLYVPKL
jgi:hypothetical protein